MRNVDVTLLVNIPLTNPEGDCTEWKINVCCCWLLLPPPLLLLLVVVLQSNDDLLQHCPFPLHRSLSHPFLPPVHGQSPARSSIHSFIRVLCALPHCDGCDPVNCIGFVQQVGALHHHHHHPVCLCPRNHFDCTDCLSLSPSNPPLLVLLLDGGAPPLGIGSCTPLYGKRDR